MSGTLTFPLDCFVGLAVAGAEVRVAGYVRQAATLATTADGATVANTATLQWSHATQPWGLVDGVLIWDAATGGSLFGSVPPTEPVLVQQYDSVRIPAGGLLAVQSGITRTYGTGRWGTYGFGTALALGDGSAAMAPPPASGSDFSSSDFSSADFATGIPAGGLGFGAGSYGAGPYQYGATVVRVDLQRTFYQQQDLCSPGTWSPGPFSMAA